MKKVMRNSFLKALVGLVAAGLLAGAVFYGAIGAAFTFFPMSSVTAFALRERTAQDIWQIENYYGLQERENRGDPLSPGEQAALKQLKEDFAPENTNLRYMVNVTGRTEPFTNYHGEPYAAKNTLYDVRYVDMEDYLERYGDTDSLPLQAIRHWDEYDPDLGREVRREQVETGIWITAYVLQDMAVEDDYKQIYDFYSGIEIDAPALIDTAIPLAICSVLLLILLCCMAGRKETDEEGKTRTLPGRLPWDVGLALFGLLIFGLAALTLLLGDYAMNMGTAGGYEAQFLRTLAYGAGGLCAAGAMILVGLVGWIAGLVKAPGWWKNCLCGRLLAMGWKGLKFAALKLWGWLKVLGHGLNRCVHALPLIWKAAVLFGTLGLAQLLLGFMGYSAAAWGGIIGFLVAAAMILVCTQLKDLQEAARRIADGDLDYRVDTKYMVLDIKDHAENLNRIGDGLSRSVEEKLRSERMKTELITNVSHDLKTPLTSIVNYVDLLKKEELTGTAGEYVEVLDRQSARLKKLTEDLVEASKASSGAITVSIERVDLLELLDQAQAEYAGRFAAAKLQAVVHKPDTPVEVKADGRHLWRVLDNLLGNAAKYAMPGTRVYLDARKQGESAVLSVKNTSRDCLDVSAEELMERFVRGDSSRHTEGSGLGLSIAQSLTQLMGGSLSITVDGDLFKAEITLPLA